MHLYCIQAHLLLKRIVTVCTKRHHFALFVDKMLVCILAQKRQGVKGRVNLSNICVPNLTIFVQGKHTFVVFSLQKFASAHNIPTCTYMIFCGLFRNAFLFLPESNSRLLTNVVELGQKTWQFYCFLEINYWNDYTEYQHTLKLVR